MRILDYRFVKLIPVLLVILLLCACSKQQPDDLTTLKQSDQYKTLDAAIYNKIHSEIIPREELPLSIAYSNSVYASISFSILSQDDKEGQAVATFTYVDLLSLADEYTGTFENVDNFYKYCIQEISSKQTDTITETVDISYTVLVEDGKKLYVVDYIENLSNILTGGTYSVLEEILNGGK